jgi:hypothetical protein
MARSRRTTRSAAAAAVGGGRGTLSRRLRPASARREEPAEPAHAPSGTALAAEALRTGILPHAIARRRDDLALPGEAERIRVGDPDDQALDNEYVGDETPGGSTPTPDQSNVDDIGRAYGLQDEDGGELRTSAEVMERRDRRRRGLASGRRGG